MITTRIAVASGKGGTGKTLVATNLAAVCRSATLVDLDVEEPNCHLFFDPGGMRAKQAFRPVPAVDLEKCTFCGKCANVCEFKAIAVLRDNVMVFPELCHGCGACFALCPQKAVSEVEHPIGEVVIVDGGRSPKLLYGRLRVREASAVPLIRQVKKMVPHDGTIIVDCPPGTACTAVESIRGADLCLLVTEPTPFGLHDLGLSLSVTKKLGVPSVVFINKAGLNGPDVGSYCRDRNIRVVGELPYERQIAEIYSKGKLVSCELEYRAVFKALLSTIEQEVGER